MVSADTIRTIVGILGNAIALGMFFSPIPTFYRILKKGSVEKFSAIPYLATLLNCMLWILYGLPIVHPHSVLVLTINGAGTAIELTYVLLFLIFSQGSRRLHVIFMLVSEIMFVAILGLLVIFFVHTSTLRSQIIGIFCVFFGTMMYVAPLSVMKLVIQTKSVEYMPLFLSGASFFNALCWTTYALIKFDLYITIPNGIGLLFALGQLVLHIMYYKSTKEQTEACKQKVKIGFTEFDMVISNDTNKINNMLKNKEMDLNLESTINNSSLLV